MARAFRRRGRGASVRYVADLDAGEREIVADLMRQVAALLDPQAPEPTGDEPFDAIVAGMALRPEPDGADHPRRDPALDRLLPSGHREDDEVASEFRRLTEGGLRNRKAQALVAAAAALSEQDAVSLDPAGAGRFLAALTDVRLVLGQRLGLERDEDLDALEAAAERADEDDPLAMLLGLYDFLTWLQETLASALLGD